MTDFVHLHVHSDYSLLDGAASVKKLASRAKELGQTALAITDHGNMFGVLNFYEACKAEGIKPIIGCEFYCAPHSRTERKEDENGKRYYHLILLAKNEVGYKNLMMLSSKSYLEGIYYKPRIDDELLQQYHEGLICLTACVAGKLPVLLSLGKDAEAEAFVRKYLDIFGEGNFYIEIQKHGLAIEEKASKKLIAIASRLGLPLVLTNDIHYCYQADSVAQDVLMCIGMKKNRSDTNRRKYDTDQLYLKSGDEMAVLFPDYPEAITNTLRIADECNLTIPQVQTKDLKNYLPNYEVPAGFANNEEYLRYLVDEGMKKRYNPITEVHTNRVQHELDIIGKMGFYGYFLIVWDFINWAKSHDIPVGPGRGSGAGSMIAYAMGITDIDPLKYGLLFERFLNPERVSMPDFDVDFCFERRQEVIEYVRQKYGNDSVGQIITFSQLKPKAVIKDVARVLGIPLAEANAIVKAMDDKPAAADVKVETLEQYIEYLPSVAEYANQPQYKELFDISKTLQGAKRQTGLHAAGVVIAKGKLIDYTPVYKEADSTDVATQFTMDKLESVGLIKMDFLGLKTLTLIKHCEQLIQKRGGEFADFSVANVSDEDPATFALLSSGNAAAVFQFESDGMINILKRCKPTTIKDLIALNALYRPGPMQYIDQFIEAKNNPAKIKYPDPSLESVLKETYGVIVYQEQVMKVAQTIAGYSLGAADMLRRAMSKKKAKVMAENKEIFIAGAVKKNFPAEKAAEIYDILIPFSQYGFNKSHAAAYSVVAYRTAYLKAHFLPEFWAANLTNEISSNDTAKLKTYIALAKKDGVTVRPPHINYSDEYFSVVDGQILFGLIGIKGLGSWAAAAIVRERNANGPYTSFMNFLSRVDLKTVGKKNIELLITTGSMDGLDYDRATLLFNLETAYNSAIKQSEYKAAGQGDLFADEFHTDEEYFHYQNVPEWSTKEKLKKEKDIMGFYLSGHPLDEYSQLIVKTCTLSLDKIAKAQKGKSYTVIGLLSDIASINTKRGVMTFARLEDSTTSVKLVLFNKVWEQYKPLVLPETICGIIGKVDLEHGEPSIVVDEVLPLKDLKEKSVSEVHVTVDAASGSPEQFNGLFNLVMANAGNCRFFIHAQTYNKAYLLQATQGIKVPSSDMFMNTLSKNPAVLEVWKE